MQSSTQRLPQGKRISIFDSSVPQRVPNRINGEGKRRVPRRFVVRPRCLDVAVVVVRAVDEAGQVVVDVRLDRAVVAARRDRRSFAAQRQRPAVVVRPWWCRVLDGSHCAHCKSGETPPTGGTLGEPLW